MLRSCHAVRVLHGRTPERSTSLDKRFAVTTIVDYGAGNLRAVQNTLDELGAEYIVTNTPESVAAAEKIILPGVGHFGQMMRSIDELRLREPLLEKIRSGIP